MTELQGNTNNTLKTLEERMNTTDVVINDVKQEQKSDNGKMTLIQESIAEQLAELETKTKDSWKSLEDGVAGRHQELQDLAVKVEGHFISFCHFF